MLGDALVPQPGGGNSTFQTTADQRYLLGEGVFLRTHLPMKLLEHQTHSLPLKIGEDDLLARLLSSRDNSSGNRLWIVYGIPGSGKSELMRWLETRIRQEDASRANVMVRVSRNELDVLSIAERFKVLLPAHFFSEKVYERWSAARKKPRALAKLILLFALENMLDSDEIINALFYRLLNVVQPHLEKVLATLDEEHPSGKVEMISMEAWEAILEETSLPISLEYEQFRHHLTQAFSQHLLEGLSLPNTLKQISQEVQKNYGTRPLLIIDDLVQSMNLFASDILDYFITLEEGNWDVVIGLTPAAFEASQRGRLMLQRITHLDTIDDRVEKLWLSDEAGYDSYVLDEENCFEFAALYLDEYRVINGIEFISSDYPFNREALVRIYRGLPVGKGKPRYFLRSLQSILVLIAGGEPVESAVAKFARTEYVARCSDRRLAAIAECYGPLISDESTREITLPETLLNLFDVDDSSLSLSIEPLFNIHLRREAVTEEIGDEEKMAVRDWLLDRDVNRQLLRPLRQGAARLLRATLPFTAIHSPAIAHPHGILSWQKPYLDIHLPISLEDIDESNGIFLSKKIGSMAFDLHRYARAVGPDAKGLEAALFNDPHFLHFFFNANDYREKTVATLEEQLGMDLDTFALSLHLWGIELQVDVSNQSSLLPEHIVSMIKVRSDDVTHKNTWRRAHQKEWFQLFEDFFKLRENLYDIPRLLKLCSNGSLRDFKESILTIETVRIGKEYRWGKRLLRDMLSEWQKMMKDELSHATQGGVPPNMQEWIDRLTEVGREGLPLMELNLEAISELSRAHGAIASNLRVYLVS